jgi:hypothetical protein
MDYYSYLKEKRKRKKAGNREQGAESRAQRGEGIG